MRISMNPYDAKIVSSFYDQIFAGKGFTEKQSNLALKIISRQKSKIEDLLGHSIDQIIDQPTFRLTRRTISATKKVSVQEMSDNVRVFKAEFPYVDEIVGRIRQKRIELNDAHWDAEEKGWLFSLDEKSLAFLLEIAEEYSFDLDETVAEYKKQVENIKSQPENFIPCLSFEDEQFVLKNVRDNVPKITSKNLVEALFEARKYGVQVWDEKISQLIMISGIDQTVINFVDSSPIENFEFDYSEYSIGSLIPVFQNLSPAIFVIPGGHEFEKLKTSLDFLNNAGVDAEEISVLFRLPSETGATLNKFVKDNKLNNPISEKTRAVFISGKLPKTVVSSKQKFNSVFNFNFYGVHYTVRELLKNHHNVINIVNKNKTKGDVFANL